MPNPLRCRLAHAQPDQTWLVGAALPFGKLWYAEPDAISNAIDYAQFYSRSHDAVIRVFDESGTLVKTHEHAGDFREP